MTRPKQPIVIDQPMPERWFAIVDRATGEAVSFGTVIADELPAHLEAIEIPAQPSKRALTRWDAATKGIVNMPAPPPRPDVVTELLADPVVSAITEKLSRGERTALEEKLRGRLS